MHFRSHPAYADLVDLFHETTYQTAHGQMLDVKTAPIGTVRRGRETEMRERSARVTTPASLISPSLLSISPQVDLNKYTLDTYTRIVTYKVG